MLTNEKQAFAARLKLALTRSAKKIDTAIELALQFNLRHPNDPITPQAAYKWLTGKARPTPDKIATLAEWLDVSPHWLHYGSPDKEQSIQTARRNASQQDRQAGISEVEARLLERLRLLTQHQSDLVLELVEQLALEREAGRK